MVKTHTFDLLVVGAGSGLNLIPGNMKVALVEKGPMGGTCLNRGCIPSKVLIHSADVAETIQRAKLFGINAKINSIDFVKITERASVLVDNDAKSIEKNIKESKSITLFKGEGKFIGDKTIKVGNDIIKAKKVIIAAGCRPTIPPIKGLDKVNYITSKEALRLRKQPKVLTIIGGGYIAVELAHFYGALGTKINLIQRSDMLLSREDDEIAEKFTEIFKKKYNILTGTEIQEVYQKGTTFTVVVKTKKGKQIVTSDHLLVATGLTPNTDVLDVKKTGVKTNKYGYIDVNDYLETSAKNIWALGDIIGTFLLKHSANYEAQIVYQNALAGQKVKRDYLAMPHAIFSSPQIAGVGYTEQELKEKKMKYAHGEYAYENTGMGEAIQDRNGFVKILVDPKTHKILGCHILGTEAATLIHEVLVAMKNNLTVFDLIRTVHIHPALSEVVQRAAANMHLH